MTPDEAETRIETLLAHRAWLRTLAARLVRPGLADDLVQETWLAALRRPPDPERAARPWLATVARRLSRRLKRTRESGQTGAEPPDPAPPTDELLARVELETDLAREVARLTEPFRRTVLLRYHEGLSSAEIARREGVPAGTVRWRLKRGLDELRARLDARFGERRTWATAFAPLAALAGGPAGGVAALSWGRIASVAAVAVLLAGAGAWRLARPGGGSPRQAEPRETAALVAAPPVDASGTPGTTPAGLAGESEPAARRPVEVAAAVAPAPALRVRFVEWDGTPSAGRLTALSVSADDVRTATSDADGAAEFHELAELIGVADSLTLAHDRAAAAPFVTALSSDALDGKQRVIELPRGAEVSGRVLVDGAPSRVPLQIVLFASDGPQRVPTFNVTARASFLFSGDVPLSARTDADGRFRFVGLDAEWSGCLAFPQGYGPPERAGHVDRYERFTRFVARPTGGLAIELAAEPHVSGRIVESDGVTPVDFATIDASVTYANGTGMMIGAATAPDSAGWFTLFPEEWPLRRVAFMVSGADGRGRRDVVFEGDDLPADGELGDVALAPGRAVLVRVTDATGGGPVEGARVRGSDARSDARGELALNGVALAATELRVGAPGFSTRPVEVPAGASEVAVALEPTTTIAVTAVGPDGAPIPALTLQWTAAGPIFAGDPGSMPDVLTSFDLPGSWFTTRTNDDGSMVGSLVTDGDGRYVGQGFRAGAAFALHAESLDGVPLAELAIAPLRDGEHREVELRTTSVPRTLALRVVDEAGAPLPRARVRLTPVGAGASGRKVRRDWGVDALGRATIPNLSDLPLRLEVDEADHLPVAIEPVVAGPDGEPREVVLRAGLRFAVRIVDAEGRAVAGGTLSHDAPAPSTWLDETEDGVFDARGVPDQPLELQLDLAGRVFRMRHDPRESEARFVVPAPGSATVAWAAPPGAAWGEWIEVALVAVDPPPADGAREMVETYYDTPSGERELAVVMPGTYRAEVRRELPDAGDDGEYEVLARSPDFAVHAGERARTTIELIER